LSNLKKDNTENLKKAREQNIIITKALKGKAELIKKAETQLSDNTRIFITKTRKLIEDTIPLFTNDDSAQGSEQKKDKERLDRIKITLNTIKESASFLQFNSILKVTETSLNILESTQKDNKISNQELNNLLVKVYTFLHILMDEIEATGNDDISINEIGRIINFLHNDHDHDISLISDLIVKAIDAFSENNHAPEPDISTEDEISEQTYSVTPQMLQTFIQESTEQFENFERASNHLSKIVRDIQDISLSIRMIPIHGVFRKMIRLVHDLSSKSSKKVQLVLTGEDTEIDKTVAELIADPLVHIIRNAIDHGIEPPNVRKFI